MKVTRKKEQFIQGILYFNRERDIVLSSKQKGEKRIWKQMKDQKNM